MIVVFVLWEIRMNAMFLFSSVGLLRTSGVLLLAKQLRTMERSYVKGQLANRV